MRSGYYGAKMAWDRAESQISGDEDQRVVDVGLGTRQTRATGGGGLDWRPEAVRSVNGRAKKEAKSQLRFRRRSLWLFLVSQASGWRGSVG